MFLKKVNALFKIIKWTLIIFLICLASLSVTLRIVLPRIEIAQISIKEWIQESFNLDVEFSSAKGDLRFFNPSLFVHDFSIKTQKYGEILTIERIDLHIDLISSLFFKELHVSHFSIDGLKLDLAKLPNQKQTQSITLAERLERLFLVDLHNFSIRNSSVTVLTPSKETKVIEIEYLKGRNSLNRHSMQGIISVQGTSLNQVDVRANFIERGGLSTLDGDFYFNGQDISLIALITPFLNSDIKLTQAKINGIAWFKVKKGVLDFAKIQLKDSFLSWNYKKSSLIDNQKKQWIMLEQGDVFLWRNQEEQWRLATRNISFKGNNEKWSDFTLKMQFSDQAWLFNINELDLSLLMAVRQLATFPKALDKKLTQLQPNAKIYDLRLMQRKGKPIAYSANVDNLSFEHWRYLPKTRNLSVKLAGLGEKGKANLQLVNTKLPYGKVLQAPLEVERSNINLFWSNTEQHLRIWSNKFNLDTPHLNVNANFLLEIQKNESPRLSLYSEVSVFDAGEMWRYLPLPALDPRLANYLTQAARDGKVKTAQIVWDGKLNAFPYRERQGIFQAQIPLRDAEFSFNTRWPPLTNFDVDLLFENNTLYLDGSSMVMLGVRGFDLSGSLKFEKNQPLRVKSKIEGSGKQLRRYILATPLVDTLGVALTHVKVDGKVNGELSLVIPFDDRNFNAQGSIKLADNHVNITTPSMKFEKMTGEIKFKNDRIWSSSLKANLLEQPVDLNFQGATVDKKYVVNVKMHGDWLTDTLKKQLKQSMFIPFTGRAPWVLNFDLALQDVDFNYNLNLNVNLSKVQTHLPSPFDDKTFSTGRLNFMASGDNYDVSAQLELPNFKYQARIDVSKPVPLIMRSRTVIGKGDLSLNPLLGNVVSVTLAELNMTEWMPIIEKFNASRDKSTSQFVSFLPISRFNSSIDKIQFPNIAFHDFSLGIRRKKEDFHFVLDSQELVGDALWKVKAQNINMNIQEFFINAIPSELKENKLIRIDRTFATKADRELIKAFPSISLTIDDLWIQGHKFGGLDMRIDKSPNKLKLTRFHLGDADTKMNVKGDWFINAKGKNITNIDFSISGKNSSVLQERFAYKVGIQGASFLTKGKIHYQSVPWVLSTTTLDGISQTQLNHGFVSGVGGAGRILGLFSLDSIIRKLKLDFSDVFDDGLAFDQISGSVSIKQGVATTKDIEMKALAGDMYIQGMADLTQNTVNANVRFVPDLTSGLPVLTAFAVAPQAAIYVLAVTTVLSPVVDAFTQIQYKITGSIDKPILKEVSRSQSVIEISEKMTERLRSQ